MIFGQFKTEIAEWYDALEAKASRSQTVAEKWVSEKIQFLHGVFGNLEAQAVVFDTKTAQEFRKVIAEAKGETSELVQKLDVALGHAAKAQAAIIAAQEQAAKAQADAGATPAPAAAPAPVTPAAPVAVAEAPTAPVVDVTAAVTPPTA